MHAFAAGVAQAPVVVSLAEALGFEAIQAMDVVCAMEPAEALAADVESRLAVVCSARPVVENTLPEDQWAPPAASLAPEQTGCPRCWLSLTPCASTGVICFSCGGSPTPGGQALQCEQCGVQICCACLPSRSLIAVAVASDEVSCRGCRRRGSRPTAAASSP